MELQICIYTAFSYCTIHTALMLINMSQCLPLDMKEVFQVASSLTSLSYDIAIDIKGGKSLNMLYGIYGGYIMVVM